MQPNHNDDALAHDPQAAHKPAPAADDPPIAHDPQAAHDAALIAQTLAGDEDAFALLYRRHLPLLLRWGLRQTGDAELTADLVAEVFAQALVSARRYDHRQGTPLAWLLGIARNKLRESRRRGRIESSARRRLRFQTIQIADADIERVEELASLDEEVMQLVEELPEDQRLALLSRVVQERSYPQIARQLRCSEAVARQRVSRGLKTLRAQVKERSLREQVKER